MIAFSAQVESSARVNAAAKTEAAWTAMASAQGTSKAMKEHVKPWADQAKIGKPRKQGTRG